MEGEGREERRMWPTSSDPLGAGIWTMDLRSILVLILYRLFVWILMLYS